MKNYFKPVFNTVLGLGMLITPVFAQVTGSADEIAAPILKNIAELTRFTNGSEDGVKRIVDGMKLNIDQIMGKSLSADDDRVKVALESVNNQTQELLSKPLGENGEIMSGLLENINSLVNGILQQTNALANDVVKKSLKTASDATTKGLELGRKLTEKALQDADQTVNRALEESLNYGSGLDSDAVNDAMKYLDTE